MPQPCSTAWAVLFLFWYDDQRDLHSFPTRRSSDLGHRALENQVSRTSVSCSKLNFSTTLMNSGSRTHRSEEHTSELQSLRHIVCRLLLEKKKQRSIQMENRSTRWCRPYCRRRWGWRAVPTWRHCELSEPGRIGSNRGRRICGSDDR